MTMTPGLRKFSLTAHITFSVGWLGAVAGFLALAVAGLNSQDAQMVRAAYLAMELIGWFVIVPLSLASLLTGLVQSLGTEWGLFRHYWVLAKLLITVLATIVLLLHMQPICHIAGVAADPDPDTSSDPGVSLRRGPSASTPRWVYVCWIAVIVLVLLFVLLHLIGGGLGALHH